MAQRFTSGILLLGFLVLLANCKRSESLVSTIGKDRSSEGTASAAAPTLNSPAPGELLQVRWPLGNRYVYRLDLNQRSTNRLGQASEPAREDVTIGLTYTLSVLGEDGEEGRVLEVEFLAYEMEIRLSDEVVISFDTARRLESAVERPVPAPFRRLIGSKLRLHTRPNGAVDRVDDLEGWQKIVAGEASGPAGQMLVQQFNEGFFRQMASFGEVLQNRPVVAGTSWPYQTSIPAGDLGVIEVTSTVTLKKWEQRDQQRFAVLEARGTLHSVPSSAHSAPVLALERGTVASTSWFDPEAGTLVESGVEQRMRFKGEAPPRDDSTSPMAFTGEMTQKALLKLVEIGTVSATAAR